MLKPATGDWISRFPGAIKFRLNLDEPAALLNVSSKYSVDNFYTPSFKLLIPETQLCSWIKMT